MDRYSKEVLVFSFSYHPYESGAEIAARKIMEKNHNVSFHVVSHRFAKSDLATEVKGNITIHRILSWSRYFYPFRAYLFARRLHSKEKFTHIWSIMAGYSGFAALFTKFTYPKIFFLLTLQEGIPISSIKKHVWFIYPLFKKIFTKADAIQAISKYLADFAKSMGGSGISVIPNGIEMHRFNNVDLSWPKNNESKKTIITTSRLVKKNAVGDIIRALSFLPEHIRLIIVGDGPEKNSLTNLSKKLSIQSRVKFMGNIPYDEIPDQLAQADIFIRPSLSEGLGNSYLEAMAAGIPIIATNVGGIPDFLTDGETGFFCRVNDPKHIAELVQMILSDEKTQNIREIIEKAHALVSTDYSWDIIANKMGGYFN
tara:strand:- start:1435 stop:2541 length:1107 start_codon:yes stop_codon:yes gene_type:complete